MTGNSRELMSAYARLLGIRSTLPTGTVTATTVGEDFNDIVESLSNMLGDNVDPYHLPRDAFVRMHTGDHWCNTEIIRSKLYQLVSFLEHVYHVNSHIIEIGSLYNSIQDAELKQRCSDLLSAPSNFDRVINQATLVLEDRIRKKSRNTASLAGVQLVNTVLNGDLAKATLKVSDVKDEHEGIGHICRGVMLAFRNPTHHQITDKYTREDALKVCAFIDNLLQLIDQASVR